MYILFFPYTCTCISHVASCVDGGYTECCAEDECKGYSPDLITPCYCDRTCFIFDDCCADISLINCIEKNGKLTKIYLYSEEIQYVVLYAETLGSVLPYISFNETDGVDTLLVPSLDDGFSPPIEVPRKFPIGDSGYFKLYVCTSWI